MKLLVGGDILGEEGGQGAGKVAQQCAGNEAPITRLENRGDAINQRGKTQVTVRPSISI